ncbi:hypothetical protein TNCV_1715831 [Trichonephila clavipes]|nr:hypothetical protein TNCV_1715831 [Trichonephila clavipes]
MVVEITRIRLRSGMKCFLTGWEVILSLAIASASVRVRLLESREEFRAFLESLLTDEDVYVYWYPLQSTSFLDCNYFINKGNYILLRIAPSGSPGE